MIATKLVRRHFEMSCASSTSGRTDCANSLSSRTNLTAYRIVRWLSPLALVCMIGCASAYHSYSGCSVPCKYCVPAPLPYAQYDERVCHSDAAEPYLAGNASPVVTEPNP